jgi:hypothetical protein
MCTDQIKPEAVEKMRHEILSKMSTDQDREYHVSYYDISIFKDPGTISHRCINEDSLVYAQFTCELEEELLEQRHKHLSIISCLGILCASIFSIAIYYQKRYSKMNQLDWDIQTITPGDYTLQYEITDEAYQWFLENVYRKNRDEENGISIALSLKTYMKAELEKMLTERLHAMKNDPNEDTSNIKISEVKIADIAFAFNNAELIRLLKLRGYYIKFQNFNKMRETEAKISQLKDERFSDITKPVEAFITFEEEDGSIVG